MIQKYISESDYQKAKLYLNKSFTGVVHAFKELRTNLDMAHNGQEDLNEELKEIVAAAREEID